MHLRPPDALRLLPPFRRAWVVTTCVLALASGCSSPPFRASMRIGVLANQYQPLPAQASFVVVPDPETPIPVGVDFDRHADFVAQALEQRGYERSNDSAPAVFEVRLAMGEKKKTRRQNQQVRLPLPSTRSGDAGAATHHRPQFQTISLPPATVEFLTSFVSLRAVGHRTGEEGESPKLLSEVTTATVRRQGLAATLPALLTVAISQLSKDSGDVAVTQLRRGLDEPWQPRAQKPAADLRQ